MASAKGGSAALCPPQLPHSFIVFKSLLLSRTDSVGTLIAAVPLTIAVPVAVIALRPCRGSNRFALRAAMVVPLLAVCSTGVDAGVTCYMFLIFCGVDDDASVLAKVDI